MNLLRGLPGHPLHPPLTDATIGIYTAATAFAVLSTLGISERNTAIAWWLALVLGLVVSVPTAVTGVIEWFSIPQGSEFWKTATSHFLAMVTATTVFLLAALFGHTGYVDGEVTVGGLVLTLVGFGLLALGGWLGGTIVFVYGMRVLKLVDEPVERAIAPARRSEEAGSAETDSGT